MIFRRNAVKSFGLYFLGKALFVNAFNCVLSQLQFFDGWFKTYSESARLEH